MKDINNKYILEITEKGKVIKTHYFNHWQERMIFALMIKQSNQKVMSEQTKQLKGEEMILYIMKRFNYTRKQAIDSIPSKTKQTKQNN